MSLDPFYPIVDSAAWIARMVPFGVKLIQLRIKEMPEEQLRTEIRTARALCAAHACQLVINDYWKLAIEEGCDFIHLGQEDLVQADITAIRSAGLKLGLSTHDHQELDAALHAAPDYIALGPIYPTLLKKMDWAPQRLDRIADWKARIGGIPLVAIGGLNPDRLPEVFRRGADSAAVVSDICRDPDPEARTQTWISATRQFRRRGREA
ncbi:MAG TPA: thiamine phosphate synthase [Dongiaceae bacterium]|nr:thiamine phosphate synthase [Dongiaceae bacterium]